MPEVPEELVRRTIASLRQAADDGDPDAIADLDRRSGSGKPAAPAAPPEPEPSALTVTERVIVRPNGEGYHVRKLGPHDDVAAIRHARTKGINVLLLGEAGTGKTALIEAALASDAADPGIMYTVQGTGDTVVDDFVGGYWQDSKGFYHWSDGPLVLAAEQGRPLYIDEIALIDAKVMAVVYSLMDGRNELRITQTSEREGGNVVTAVKGFYVCASTNPKAPGARMSEALLSRFSMQPSVTTDLRLARQLGVDKILITATGNLQRKLEDNKVSWVPQMRELLDFKRISEEFGKDLALRNLIATAPEQDRTEVSSTLSRSFAKHYSALEVN